MNTRLSQDAADTLAAYERQQKWRADAKADAERAKPYHITGSLQHFATEAQRQAHQDWIKQHEAVTPF